MYEVILSNGDRATADSEARILYAARTLISEGSRAAGAMKILRRDVLVISDGIYSARLTQAARRGE